MRQPLIRALMLLCLGLGACQPSPRPIASQDAGVSPTSAPVPAGPTFKQELSRLDSTLQRLAQRAVSASGSQRVLIAQEQIALLLRRARLSGSHLDLQQAEALLSILDGSAVPHERCLTEARVYLALHRPERAARAIAPCVQDARPEMEALQVDIGFLMGDYAAALERAQALLNQQTIPAHLARVARLRWALGQPAEAVALLEAAERRYHVEDPVQIASFRLQRGLLALDRGQLDRARALYLKALEALPGWWVAQEHLAEVLALEGRHAAAQALYGEIVANGHAQPLVFDALADLLDAQGEEARAGALRAQAHAALVTRLEAMPDAFGGHAVNHFLAHQEFDEAVHWARQDYLRRPHGEAAITYAESLLARNASPQDLDQADSLLTREYELGWRSPQLLWTLAQVRARQGQDDAVADLREQASRLNPRIATGM